MYNFLITGSNGYVGKILVEKLLKTKNKLITISNYRENKHKDIYHLKSNILTNFNLKNKKVKTILHMAAKNIYTQKINDFESFIKYNVQTTIKLAEFAKKNKVKKIIFFSSLAIYGQSNLKVINNKSPYYDINFYGLTKLMSEGILREYSKYFSVYILRVPGVIDKDQYVPWPWLNLIKNNIKKNIDIRYFNPKKKFNSLTSVDDITKIIHAIDEKKEKNVFKIYNFGGNKPIKLIDILKKIKKKYKSKSKLLSFNNNKHSSIIDNSYIEKDLKIKLSNTEKILNNFLSQN